MKRLKYWAVSIILASSNVLAQRTSIGDVAANLAVSATAIAQLIRTICIITGVCFILGSIVQYRKHRSNPMEVRLSSVFFTLIIGLVLIALTFIPFGV